MSLLFMLVSTSGLVDIAIKSIAVMLLAWAAASLLRRASAAWRHLVWCLSVVSLLLLPALALALPNWRVTWLPRWAAGQTHAPATGHPAHAKADTMEPLDGLSPTTILLQPSAPAAATEAHGSPSATAVATTSPPRGPVPWLAIGWAVGMLLSLVPLACGLWQLAALHRRSRVIGDQRWLSLLGELRRQLELRRNVQLRQSEAALVPLTWGALKAVLLVPAEASAWPDERRRLVLLHELAHVRRWDWLTQLVAHVACAMYWFNPLVWLAARQMRIERERACDDLVLASGARASDYAQELLAVAAGLSNSQLSPLVAVPMARCGALEHRLRGILDGRRSRTALTTAAVCLGAALAAASVTPLAMLRAALPESAASETAEPKKEPSVKEQPTVDKPAVPGERPAEQPTAQRVTIRGKVVDDATGKPIERLVTQAGKFDPADPTKVTWGFDETRSEVRDGSFSATVRWAEGWTARIVADGYISQPVVTSAPPAGKTEIRVTIRLKRGPTVRGVVLDHSGKPLQDAAVFVVGPTSLNLAAGQAWRHDGKDEYARPVRTDEQGRFELPTGEAKWLAVSHVQFDAWPAAIPTSGDITIRLPEPVHVDIELAVDGADKESVIFYQLLSHEMPEFAGLQSSREVKMANPGKLSLTALPPGKYQICRNVRVDLGEMGIGAMLDRQYFELKAGESTSIRYVRDKGSRVRGKVTWPADTKLMGIAVTILSEKAEKGPFGQREWPTTYASQTAAADGTFRTERIAPGPYLLVAEGYSSLTTEHLLRLGGPHNLTHRAQIRIDVPNDGELKVDDLALKPIRAEVPQQEPPAKEKPAAEKPAEKPAAKTTTIRGKVLDDATGEPIGKLIIQAGKFEPADPKKLAWGFVETTSSSRDGSFSTTVRWSEGWTARIVADGYIPQPVLTSAPPADKDQIEVTIRLKRGAIVRGVVLDHMGKPVKDAAVFAIGPTGLNLAAGQAWSRAGGNDDTVKPVRTDEQGRFELPTGEAKSLAVSHAQFDAWPAAIPAQGEVTIRLPEPTRVDIHLAVDGAEKDSVIFYQLLTEGGTEFAGLRLEREVTMANPGKLALATLPPGRYQLSRNVRNHMGGAMLERQFFELKAGETKSIHFVREKGARVRGKATWPADTKLVGIVISVRSEKAEKSPFNEHEWVTIYASHAAAADGTFLTERIAPGKYLLVADGYSPRTDPPESTRLHVPSFHAQVTIEVPAEGELKAGDLALKPLRAAQ
jgi:beta-lactamase regulating signal transducer with metallopeptidase domain